jgi:hypothetical protein
MDQDYYGPVIPRHFRGLDTPDEPSQPPLHWHHASPTGYACGLLIAAYQQTKVAILSAVHLGKPGPASHGGPIAGESHPLRDG